MICVLNYQKIFLIIDNDTVYWYHIYVNNKQRKTLGKIFQRPTLCNIAWKDIESLLKALGADVVEGEGSRIGIELNSEEAVFHKPHPQKEASKGAVNEMRNFLIRAKVVP